MGRMIGEVVYKNIINGLNVLIRYPQDGDAGKMCDYINTLSKEKTFISAQGEHFSLMEEQEYLDHQLKAIKEKKCVQLLLFVDNNLAGISAIDMQKKIASHTGIFGISLAQDFRGMGLGKLLMKTVLDEGAKNLDELRIVTLQVFAENEKARNMYKSFGFKEYGYLPEGNKYKDGFSDDVLMYKLLKTKI